MFGMKRSWRWTFRKLRSRQRSGHEDPQILGHVGKASQQDAVVSDAHGRLPTDPGDWVALTVLSPQNRHNEADISSNTPTMSERIEEHAQNVSKEGRKTQPSSSSHESSIYIQARPRIDSYTENGALPFDIDSQETGRSPSSDPGQLKTYGKVKRRSSPSLIRKISPDGNMTILLDLTDDGQTPEATTEKTLYSRSVSREEIDSGFPHDGISLPAPAMNNFDYSESMSGLEDQPEPTLLPSDPLKDNQNNRGYSLPLLQAQSESEVTYSDQTDEELASEDRDHLRFIWRKSPLESTRPDKREITEPPSNGQDRLEPVFGQECNSEPKWAGPEYPMLGLEQQNRSEPILERPDDPVTMSTRRDILATLPGDHQSEFGSPELNPILIPDRQSRPGSLRSQKSLTTKDQQRRFRREARLHTVLSRNLQTRARAYEKRSQLRQSRFETSNADEAFMKLVRERSFQSSQDDVMLKEAFKKLQDARDEYGPLEEAYNAVEEQLNREEYESKELEDRILKSEISRPDLDMDSRSSVASEDNSDVSETIRELYHPLYEAYLSRLGDADLCREAVAELMNEHDNLLHAQEVRRRVGVELSLDDQATLENFPVVEAELLDELRRTEEAVELLWLECVREGLVAENEGEHEIEVEEEAADKGDGEEDSRAEEIDLSQSLIGSLNPEQTEYNKYPLLLERPEEKEDENKSRVLLTDFKEGDVGDRITCWLLHKLRASGLEVELLARFNNGLDRNADTEKWQEEVLAFWFLDSANRPSSAYQLEPSLTALPASQASNLNLRDQPQLGAAYLIQMVVRSSALSQRLDFALRLKLTRMKGRSAVTV